MVVATHLYLCTCETLKRIRVDWCERMGELLGDNARQTEAVGEEGTAALIWSTAARQNERAAGDWR